MPPKKRLTAVFGVAPPYPSIPIEMEQAHTGGATAMINQYPTVDQLERVYKKRRETLNRVNDKLIETMEGTIATAIKHHEQAQPLLSGIKSILQPLMPKDSTFNSVEKRLETLKSAVDNKKAVQDLSSILGSRIAAYMSATTLDSQVDALRSIGTVLSQPSMTTNAESKTALAQLQNSVIKLLEEATPIDRQGMVIDTIKSVLPNRNWPGKNKEQIPQPPPAPAPAPPPAPAPAPAPALPADPAQVLDLLGGIPVPPPPPPPPPAPPIAPKKAAPKKVADDKPIKADPSSLAEEAVNMKDNLRKTPSKPKQAPKPDPMTASFSKAMDERRSMVDDSDDNRDHPNEDDSIIEWFDNVDEAVRPDRVKIKTQLTRDHWDDDVKLLKLGTDRGPKIRLRVLPSKKDHYVILQPQVDGVDVGKPIDTPISLLDRMNKASSTRPVGREVHPFIDIFEVYTAHSPKGLPRRYVSWIRKLKEDLVPDDPESSSSTGSGVLDIVQSIRDGLRAIREGRGLNWRAPTSNNDVELDTDAFAQRRVRLKRGGEVFLDQPFDMSFLKLMNDRFNPKYPYTPDSIKLFRRVVPELGLKLGKGSTKWNMVYNPPGAANSLHSRYVSLLIDDPNEWAKRLVTIIGSIQAGNTSRDLKDEAVSLVDMLHSRGHIPRSLAQTYMSSLI